MRALTPRTFMHEKGPFPVVFLGLLLAFFSVVNTMNGQRNENQFVVVLDAGHGGHDPGNLGNGYLEKNIALSIVLNAGAILERTPGIKVVYTRKDDTFVDLYVRGEIANKANADLFVSVHCDSHTSNAHGAGTFVLGLHANKQNFEIAKKENSVIYLEDNYESRYADYDINSPESVIGLTIMQEEFLEQSIALAKGIQQNFSGKLKRKDRQVKQAGFIVLHQTFMPSVLVETGFLTNDNEGAYLNSRRGQLEMGTSIAEAIIAYRGGVQSGGAPTTDVSVSTPVPADSEVAVNKDTNPPKNTDAAKEFAKNPGSNPLAEKTQETVSDGSPDQNMEADKEKLVVEDPDGPETKEVVTDPVSEPSDNTTDEDQGKIQQEVVLSNGESSVKKEPKETTSNNTTKASEVPTPKEVVTKTPPKNTVKNIVFKVQLMASKKEIALQASNFRGLRTLSKERFNEFYRYMYGNTESYAQAKILKSNADARGYPTSYIVAYKDGVRIPTPEAIKLVSE